MGMMGLDGEDGESGPPGPIGLTGPAGAFGPMGMPGLDGEDGEMGPPGVVGPRGVDGLRGPPGIDAEAEDWVSAGALLADHDYARLLGRGNGQTLAGGVAVGDNLTLLPNSAAVPADLTTRGVVQTERVWALAAASSYTFTNGNLFPFVAIGDGQTGPVTPVSIPATYAGFADFAALTLTVTGSTGDGPFGFVSKKTITTTKSIQLPFGGFSFEDTVTAPTGKTITLLQNAAMFRDWTIYTQSGTGHVAGVHTSFVSMPAIGTGLTMPEVDGFIAMAPAGNVGFGTVTQWVAFVVDDPLASLTGNTAATQTNTGISFKSYSAIMQTRHAGPGVYMAHLTAGEPDGPSNTSVGLEVQGTTTAFRPSELTTAQRDALTALEGMQVENTSAKWMEMYDGTAWRGSSPVQAYTWGTVTVPDGYGAVVADQWTITGSDMVTLQGTACIVVA